MFIQHLHLPAVPKAVERVLAAIHVAAALKQLERVVAECQPCCILRPSLTELVRDDGSTVWLAEHGSVLAWGRTPDEAYGEFNRIWFEGNAA